MSNVQSQGRRLTLTIPPPSQLDARVTAVECVVLPVPPGIPQMPSTEFACSLYKEGDDPRRRKEPYMRRVIALVLLICLMSLAMVGIAFAHSIDTPGQEDRPLSGPGNPGHAGHSGGSTGRGHSEACQHAEQNGSVDFQGGTCGPAD